MAVLFLVITLAVLFWHRGRIFDHLSFTSNYQKKTFDAIWEIEKAVLETLEFEQATEKVVNIILTQLGYLKLGYQVVVLTLLDEEKNELRRIAISETESAKRFLEASPVPFHEIVIPLDAKENLLVKTIKERKKFVTSRVADVLSPALSRQWVHEFQMKLGIKTSLVYPLVAKEKILGALIFSLTKEEEKISEEEWSILDSFVGAVGIALDNAILFRSLKDTTEKLKVANEKLKELDKLKDEFVSVASHELRTPMTAIKSYLWLALYGKAGPLNEKQAHYLDRAYFSTERLIKLVNNMLNVSRIEAGRIELEPSKFSMPNLIKDVVEEVTPRAAELGVKVVQAKDGAVSPVLADYDKIREVLINLIGNSLKFTPAGGSITISSRQKDGMVETQVTDTGKGISKDDLPKLFHKFGLLDSKDGSFVVAQVGGGTGLGLYISKELLKMHGGQIWATSSGEGKGATFTFTLKVAPKKFVVREKKPEENRMGIIPTII